MMKRFLSGMICLYVALMCVSGARMFNQSFAEPLSEQGTSDELQIPVESETEDEDAEDAQPEEPAPDEEPLEETSEEPSDAGEHGGHSAGIGAQPALKVRVYIENAKDVYREGDIVVLKGEIEEGTCENPSCQWQVCRNKDGADGTWENLPGATDWIYTFAITAENYGYYYRLVVEDMGGIAEHRTEAATEDAASETSEQ